MGLWPAYGDESAFLRLIDSKQVTRDFRGSVIGDLSPVGLQQLDQDWEQSRGMLGPLERPPTMDYLRLHHHCNWCRQI